MGTDSLAASHLPRGRVLQQDFIKFGNPPTQSV